MPISAASARTCPRIAFSSAALPGRTKVRQRDVERVQLVEVPVPSDGWARTAVTGATPIVRALAGAGRQRRRLDALGQSGGRRGDVDEHPVDPRHLRRGGIGRVRVVDDEREAPGVRGRAAPGERRGDVPALARVERRNRTAGRKRAGSDREAHRLFLSRGDARAGQGQRKRSCSQQCRTKRHRLPLHRMRSAGGTGYLRYAS